MTGAAKPFGSVQFAADPRCGVSRDRRLRPGTLRLAPRRGSSRRLRDASCHGIPHRRGTVDRRSRQRRAEMGDQQPTQQAGFAVMGSHMAHQFACQGTTACVMFVSFDGAYDIKWGKKRPLSGRFAAHDVIGSTSGSHGGGGGGCYAKGVAASALVDLRRSASEAFGFTLGHGMPAPACLPQALGAMRPGKLKALLGKTTHRNCRGSSASQPAGRAASPYRLRGDRRIGRLRAVR